MTGPFLWGCVMDITTFWVVFANKTACSDGRGELVMSAVVIRGEVVSAPRCVVTPRVIIAPAVSPLEL